MELKGQVIIITGGASGIGLEASRALARMGADLIIADYNEDGAITVAAEISASGVRAHGFKVDVSKAEQVAAMVDFAVEKLGTLNGIFNNAGIGLVKPFLEMPPAITGSSKSTNTASTMACTTPRRRWSLWVPKGPS